MNKLFYPLSSLQEVYTLMYLSGNLDIDIELPTITSVFNSLLKTMYKESILLAAIKKFHDLMSADKNLFATFSKNLKEQVNANKIKICEAPFLNCKFCNRELIYTNESHCVVFTLFGPKKGLLRSKFCSNCLITFNSDNYIQNNEAYVYRSLGNIDVIVTSSETVVEISLLKEFDNHLIRNAVTFSGNCFFLT